MEELPADKSGRSPRGQQGLSGFSCTVGFMQGIK